jgi:hypothetical protein
MLNKVTRDLFILFICACASYLFVIVICYLFICTLLVDHIFCSLFDYFFVLLFISFLINPLFSCSNEKKNNSDPELCLGISIPLTVHHHQYESINIMKQTPLT